MSSNLRSRTTVYVTPFVKKELVKDKSDLETQMNSIKSDISKLNPENNRRLNELYGELNRVQKN